MASSIIHDVPDQKLVGHSRRFSNFRPESHPEPKRPAEATLGGALNGFLTQRGVRIRHGFQEFESLGVQSDALSGAMSAKEIIVKYLFGKLAEKSRSLANCD